LSFKENCDKNVHVSRYKAVEKNKSDAIFGFASKAIVPSDKELAENNRSRSAKLRYAIKN
jgi:16S rRNA C1402 N4-methylase RsmH